MIPQPPEFFDLFSTDHRRLEAAAAAERLRGPGGLRTRTASILRATADHIAPPSAPPRTAGGPAPRCRRPARARGHPGVETPTIYAWQRPATGAPSRASR